jgi:hypothetical protein
MQARTRPEGPGGLAGSLASVGEDSATTTTGGRGAAGRTEKLVRQLNETSRRLVKLLEDGLPESLEKEWRNGNVAIYTHHLYRRHGEQLADEISRRYAREAQMRECVDDFIRSFEQLLDTVSEAPQGEELVDSCLESETGKLYLLLAQATGRLGNA